MRVVKTPGEIAKLVMEAHGAGLAESVVMGSQVQLFIEEAILFDRSQRPISSSNKSLERIADALSGNFDFWMERIGYQITSAIENGIAGGIARAERDSK